MQQKLFNLLAASLIVLFPFNGMGQNWELGGFIGTTSNYSDPSNEFKVQNLRYSLMGFARKHLDKHWTIRANVAAVRIAGIDSISSSYFQQTRNLNFFTDILEVSGQVEYNLLEDKTRGRRIKNRTIPYVFLGLGLAYYIPKTIHVGSEYELAPLQTGGKNYSQLCLVMPMGAGVRYYLSPRWQIGFEIGMRLTSTSYLDDIESGSKYPDPADLPSDLSRYLYDRSAVEKDPVTGLGFGHPGYDRSKLDWLPYDIYLLAGMTISYKFNIVGGSRIGGRALRCPRFY